MFYTVTFHRWIYSLVNRIGSYLRERSFSWAFSIAIPALCAFRTPLTFAPAVHNLGVILDPALFPSTPSVSAPLPIVVSRALITYASSAHAFISSHLDYYYNSLL